MSAFFSRITILFLFVAAWCLSFLRAPKRSGDPTRVLIIQMAKLGDMVCTTPMIRAVKTAYPHAELHVLGNSINREVLWGNPHVDAYHAKEKGFWRMVQGIRLLRIDAACITVPSFELLALCVCARIPLVVVPRIENGWSPYETVSYRLLRTRATVVPHRMESYAPREYLRLLEPLGIHTDDTKKEVAFSEAARERVREYMGTESGAPGENIRIGILPGAGNEIKSWPPQYFAELITLIHADEASAHFILLGGEKDKERGEVIKKNIPEGVHLLDFIGHLSLDELKAMINELTLVIGADTGPQYIAEALGIPTIDIVGPVDEREQPPMGPLHRIVKADRTRPELYVMNARVYNAEEAKRQVEAITPSMVFTEFSTLKMSLHKSTYRTQ